MQQKAEIFAVSIASHTASRHTSDCKREEDIFSQELIF